MKRDFFQIVRDKGGHRMSRVEENNHLRKVVGKRFKLAREMNGWSQEVAAAKLDYVNSTQLSLAEKGERLPPMAKIMKASEVFGVSIDYLMGVSDEPERDPRLAERQATLRHVNDVMETTSRTIVTAVLAHQSSAPSMVVTKKLATAAESAIQAVEQLRASNLKAFDEDLRGAATVLRTVEELQVIVQQARAAIHRHEQVSETAIRTIEHRLGTERPLFESASTEGGL